MNERIWLRVFAAFTLVTALLTMGSFPMTAELSGLWQTPILAFEFARTPADLAFLSGDANEPVRQAMDRGHGWDVFFPMAYGGLFALWARNRPPSAWRSVAIGAALLATPFDWVENLQLVHLTETLRQGGDPAPRLWWLMAATSAKWLAIATVTAFLGSTARDKLTYMWGTATATVIVAAVVTARPLFCEATGMLSAVWFARHILGVWFDPPVGPSFTDEM